MCGVSLKEKQPTGELQKRLGVEAIGDVMRRCRLRWHCHMKRKGATVCSGMYLVGGVEESVGRPNYNFTRYGIMV